jgi:hypothetical protein
LRFAAVVPSFPSSDSVLYFGQSLQGSNTARCGRMILGRVRTLKLDDPGDRETQISYEMLHSARVPGQRQRASCLLHHGAELKSIVLSLQ